MSNQMQGLLLVGQLAGHRQFKGVSKKTNKPFVMNFVGVRTVETDRYGGISEQLTEVRLSDNLIDAGIITKIQKMTGENVALKVYVSSFAKGENAYFDLNLSNDDDNIVALDKATVKAA